jgi:Flp pilus assembly protein TadD
MGVYHEELGDIGEAIAEYKKALKANAQEPAIHLSLASSFVKNNDLAAAISELNATVKLDPEAVEPHAILALLYSAQNQTELATSEYEAALKNASKLQPQNVQVYKSLGGIYIHQKKFKEAKEVYKLSVQLAPGDAEAHFYLATACNELKESAEAEKELKKALELKPDFHEALNFLGYIYAEENRNLDQAETMIRKALEMQADNGAYIDSLGWVYFQKGKTKEAIQELEKASSLMDDPVIFEHLGDAYLKLEDNQKAKLNWEKSLQLDPGQEKVKEKLEKLNSSLMTKSQIQNPK